MALLTSELFKNATANAAKDNKVPEATKASGAWLGMQDVNKKLEACAARDPDHITPRPKAKGPHVTLIHQALEALAAAATIPVPPNGVPGSAADAEARLFNAALKAAKANPISKADREASEYGDSTAKAVLAYKTAREIKRPGMPIDNVVGIMTIKALDRDLLLAKGSAPPPTPPVDPKQVKFRDVIVAISAVGHRADVSTLDQLSGFIRPRVISEEYTAKTDRDLTILGALIQTTQVSDVIKAASSVSVGEGQQLGKVLMYGISLGGKQIIEVAKAVGSKIAIDYVGTSDVAFFHADMQEKPDVTFNNVPKDTPLAKGAFGAFKAGRKVNVFQIKGNRSKIISPLNGGIMWSSFMDGEEVHGKIPSFDQNDDVSSKCVKTDHTDLHGEAARLGEDQILGDMQGIFKKV